MLDRLVKWWLVAWLVASGNVLAGTEPFATCPSKAFLVQTSVAKIYGVNLVTGSSPLLAEDMGTTDKLNAMGFSVHDRFLYAWAYEHGTLARIGKDFQIVPLAISDLPNKNFYVGDVSVTENRYYMYSKSNGFGLYSIDLDAQSPDYLTAVKRVDASVLKLNIFDLAFHPNANYAYSVDSGGNLHQIDVSAGSATNLGNVGESGTFGAVYFDVEGTFYISRNADGHIFRIDVSSASPRAELFAVGPSSSNNDGARCATAPLIDEDDTSVDFGDAPDSYGTSLQNNGARHEWVEDGLFLGRNIDGEPVAAIYPNSDDDSGLNDDDGVFFINSFEAGLGTIVQIEASKAGVLSAWLDVDQSGTFDDNEQVIVDFAVDAGVTRTMIEVPSWAEQGDTWLRFRIANVPNLGPTGGVLDGEVEDYPVFVAQGDLSVNYYPSQNDWVTLAYEDNWPQMGDYDVNDVVVKLRATAWRDQVGVRKIKLQGSIEAVGASYHNGFAIRLQDIDINSVDPQTMRVYLNNQLVDVSAIEPRRSELILIVTEDVWSLVGRQDNCRYFNTETGCFTNQVGTFTLEFQLAATTNNTGFVLSQLDPFIFATPNTFHGAVLGMPGRAWEVHLKNYAPTEAFDSSLWGMSDDASVPANGHYFQTANGMPWAFQINTEWAHPTEATDLLQAYPLFQGFVESNGLNQRQWFTTRNAVQTNVVK